MPTSHCQLLIAGAGPVGLSLAAALQKSGVTVTLADARAAGACLEDRRVLALSHGSKQILQQLGAWSHIEATGAATPIRQIHVSQQGGLGRTRIDADELRVPALGYVVPASEVSRALLNVLPADAVQYGTRVVEAHEGAANAGEDGDEGVKVTLQTTAGVTHQHVDVLAWCEGTIQPASATSDASQTVREHDYEQHALIGKATPIGGHRHIAYERFTPHGPIALLPMQDGYSVVFTCPSDQLGFYTSLSEAEMISLLEREFNGRIHFESVSPLISFPLGLRVRRERTSAHQVWLGNAAQTLHPVAGQGFNLALRDVMELAQAWRSAGHTTQSIPNVLAQFAKQRQLDRAGTIGFTDMLVRLFSNANPLLKHARGAGLLALDLCPPARHFVARRMMFGARAWP